MHYAWVKKCVELLAERESFIAAQNPILMDFLEFESAEQVRESFLICESRKAEDGRRTLNYRNLREAEAAEFYQAYNAGYQYVSELLQVRGLW